MHWFERLKNCLALHYDPSFPKDVVGFLQGSQDRNVWLKMAEAGSGQMLVLGNRPPSSKEWEAAGVAQRHNIQEIKIKDLNGFVIVYGGFMYRPWGHIVVSTSGIMGDAFSASIQSWTRNFMSPK